MKTPSITPAQVKAAVIFVFGVAAALGLRVSGEIESQVADALVAVSAAFPSVLVVVDALIRRGRAQNADKIAAAQPAPTPVHITVAAPAPATVAETAAPEPAAPATPASDPAPAAPAASS